MPSYYWNVKIFDDMATKDLFSKFRLGYIFLWLFAVSCQFEVTDNKHVIINTLMRHAQMIKAEQVEYGILLEIRSPYTNEVSHYLLQDSITQVPDDFTKFQKIKTPLKGLIALSSTQWTPLLKIGKEHLILGISESGFVYDSVMKELLAKGSVLDVMKNGILDFEKTISLQPELILYSPGLEVSIDQLKRTGLPLFMWPDYLENSPLGRAEWLRVIGWLTGEEAVTEAWFDHIENEYFKLKSLISDTMPKATIMSDKAFNEQWYVPGGKSYLATIFKDAGADYIWKGNNITGSVALDLETIISQASEADFWFVTHFTDAPYSYEDLKNENEIYAGFKAFRNRKIIFCNTFRTAYFETSQFQPHVVLADFIAILHPHLLPEHKPVYHQLLKEEIHDE